jgi:hypothetical protein
MKRLLLFVAASTIGVCGCSSGGGGTGTSGSGSSTTTNASSGSGSRSSSVAGSSSGSSTSQTATGGSSTPGSSTSVGSSSGSSSSSSGSSSSSSGSSNGGSSSNGSSSGGSGTVCVPPPDAGWPLNCGTERQVYLNRSLPTLFPIADLSMIPMPGGGYLLGVLLGPYGAGAQFIAIAADGTTSDAGYLGCTDTADNNDCPVAALSLVSTGAGVPPTMVAGYFPPNTSGDFTDQFACWSPYGGTSPVPVSLNSVGSTQADVAVSLLRTASVGSQLAVAVTDYTVGQDALAIGPVGGGCPTTGSATLVHPAAAAGLAVTPSGLTATPFLTAEELTGPDDLGLSLVPGGASTTAAYGSTNATDLNWPAVASDGTTFAALTGSDASGVQLFTGSVAGLTPMANGEVLAPPPSFAVSATSCGAGCALAGWIANGGGPDGGPETPTFAFVDPQGCADYVTLAAFSDDTGKTALTAVAAQAGGAAIAYASSYANGTSVEAGRVNVRLCTP